MTAPARAAQPAAAALAFERVAAAGGAAPPLQGVSLAVPPGGLVALVGPSGAGKTRLLRLALGFERPAAGAVRVLGEDPAAPADARALRLRVGMVWPSGALLEDLDVAGNVGFALREVARRPAAEVARAVHESLLLVGLKHVEHLRVDELGESVRRRVALARAVAHRPELLLLDEPAGGLDPVAAGALRTLVAQLRERLGLAVLLASRDPAWAFPIADRVAILHAGRIHAEGPPAVLRGGDERVAQLLAGRAHGPIAP